MFSLLFFLTFTALSLSINVLNFIHTVSELFLTLYLNINMYFECAILLLVAIYKAFVF